MAQAKGKGPSKAPEAGEVDVDSVFSAFEKVNQVASGGKSFDAEVVGVETGLYQDLISPKLREIVAQRNPDRLSAPAIRITFKAVDIGIEWSEVFVVPKNPLMAKNSRLYKFWKRYGKPTLHQKVEAYINERGFPRVVV